MTRTFWLGMGLVVALALLGRTLLLASNAVSFHSDEAVVALMARHILQGERPVFFYGQAYMGSLDAWLVAVGFALFGESVASIRIVQSALYLLVVASGYWVAWRLSGKVVVAVVAGLTLAVPTVLLATYTTATLGGYNETLLLGNLLLLLGYEVTHDHVRSWWRWGLLGVAAGLGWWTNGLIVAYALPVGILILKRLFESRQTTLLGIGVALIGFFAGSAPWWVFAFEHDLAPLRFYLGSTVRGEFAGTDMFSLPFGERLIGLFFLGAPTLFGMRFPWTPTYFAPLFGAVVLLIFIIALFRLVRRSAALKPDAHLLVLSMIGLFCVLYLASRFSTDPTGRYFLPLALPLGIVFGVFIASIRRVVFQIALVAVVLVYFAAGQINAATTNPPGLTTQFNLVTHIPNDDDDALIAFVDEHQLYNGYTNYWISFRVAFLSGERMQYSAALPYKPDLSYTPLDERYPTYRAATDSAERIAYITANVPEVEAELEALFAASNVTYQTSQVGSYRIYYDFTPPERAPRPPLPFVNP